MRAHRVARARARARARSARRARAAARGTAAPGAASCCVRALPAARATARAPHRRPPALLASAPRMPRAPPFRGSLCRRDLQSARENEIGRVQRERK